MYIALDTPNRRVHIDHASKSEQYWCPVCSGELVVKKGTINAHHFAHKNGTDCDTWCAMSAWHKDWQDCFPEDCREVVLGNHRADIKLDPYVIEFQHSPLSQQDLMERINYYTGHGTLVFVFDLRDKPIVVKTCSGEWRYPSKSIIPPNNTNYYVFFQVNDNELLFVEQQLMGWETFTFAKKLTRAQFIKLFTHNLNVKSLLKIQQLEFRIEDLQDDLKIEKKKLYDMDKAHRKETYALRTGYNQENYVKQNDNLKVQVYGYEQKERERATEIKNLQSRCKRQENHIKHMTRVQDSLRAELSEARRTKDYLATNPSAANLETITLLQLLRKKFDYQILFENINAAYLTDEQFKILNDAKWAYINANKVIADIAKAQEESSDEATYYGFICDENTF